MSASNSPKKSSHKREASKRPRQWLFLYEEMASDTFKLRHKTMEEVQTTGSSLGSILGVLHLDQSESSSYCFWMISNSLKTAVQLLTDASVYCTYEIYCKDDPVVTIIVRPNTDPSPNTSQTPSAHSSLRERRKLSGQHSLQNALVRPRLPSDSSQLDIISREPISELPEEEKIVLDIGPGETEVFATSYLIDWIKGEVERGVDLESIVVTTLTPRYRPVKVTLNKDIWTKSLLRGPSSLPFLEIWNAANEKKTLLVRMDHVSKLFQQYPYVRNNAMLFIQDLFSFLQPAAKKRMDRLTGPYFIGTPYFSDAASQEILAIPFDSSTLRGGIERLLGTKAGRDQVEIRSSHELAPMLLRAFGFEKDEVMAKLELQKIRDPHKKGEKGGGTTRNLKHKFSLFTMNDG